jgi:VIT1/CCC1 family predicted Fe2+/Mn2+ transporter
MRDPLASWRDEQQSAYLYRVLAGVEHGTPRATLFDDLARAAEQQAAIWARGLPAPPPVFRPRWRARLVAALVRRLGPRRVRPVLAAMKVRGMSVYRGPALAHPAAVSAEDVRARHRGAGGGNLRAAVFGVNDGLVSNASLILGVAGAASDPGVILLSGIAGLLAGAFSMASGEYVSVRSQREMYEHQIGLERDELAKYPAEEAAELALIYAARGIPRAEAEDLARRLIADPRVALDTLVRDELGLNPEELGSPGGAALFSFLAFAAGAAIPLAPFLFTVGLPALLIAMALASVSLFAVGAVLSLFSGRGALRGGLRMLLIGAAAGAATFTIGRALGVAMA